MATASINPVMAKLPVKEQEKWVALMNKHHPEHDWGKLMADLNEENPKDVKGTGRKGKDD